MIFIHEVHVACTCLDCHSHKTRILMIFPTQHSRYCTKMFGKVTSKHLSSFSQLSHMAQEKLTQKHTNTDIVSGLSNTFLSIVDRCRSYVLGPFANFLSLLLSVVQYNAARCSFTKPHLSVNRHIMLAGLRLSSKSSPETPPGLYSLQDTAELVSSLCWPSEITIIDSSKFSHWVQAEVKKKWHTKTKKTQKQTKTLPTRPVLQVWSSSYLENTKKLSDH